MTSVILSVVTNISKESADIILFVFAYLLKYVEISISFKILYSFYCSVGSIVEVGTIAPVVTDVHTLHSVHSGSQ
jgi:hypothetical protein